MKRAILLAAILTMLEANAMQLSSPAFKQNEALPVKYTCDGEDISPQLAIDEIPANTQSFALVMDDPDAVSGTFDHWIAWNIPGSTKTIAEGEKLPSLGSNGFGSLGYRGPCPPRGKPHHYHFKLFALDIAKLDLKPGASKAQLEKALQGHILDETVLIGTYQRQQK
jgi:Raf kinase inhibitor-like YbhB/YbcL family protein